MGEDLKLLTEPSGFVFTGRADSPGVIAPIAPSTGEAAIDLAAELRGVEVIPPDFLDVVIDLR